jgi:hypothetical protein
VDKTSGKHLIVKGLITEVKSIELAVAERRNELDLKVERRDQTPPASPQVSLKGHRGKHDTAEMPDVKSTHVGADVLVRPERSE